MPIQTDLKSSPYFDDYDVNKDYYKILFQPGVPVQVRELNQLQTILQKQIERFGDNVLKRGTVVDGCEPTFFPDIDFVKIKDTQAGTSAAVNVVNYSGLLAENSAGLLAEVIETAPGFEGTDPNLNTLYLNYLNFTGSQSGNNYSVTFSNDDVLTLFSRDRRVHSITINTTAAGFLSTDTVVIYPAIEVQNTAGGTTFTDTFSPGDTLVFAGSRTVVVVEANATANSEALVLRVKPANTALAVTNTANWNLATGSSLIHSANGQEVVLAGFVGAGASANVVLTPGATEISSLKMNTFGQGYYVAPTVTVASNTAGVVNIDLLDASALLYAARVEVANTLVAPLGNIVGTAYGMSVNEGIVYQKGYFQRVSPQFKIVEKYSNAPNEVAVGFSTVESIVDYREDSSLVDNAAGFLNANAPGANRFKLTPTLAVKTEEQAAEDSEFFSLYKFADGKVWSQSTKTEYHKIREELALRTFEESGNYVLDRFEMVTRSTFNIANSDTHFTYLIDPGHAYVNGYRLKTNDEYTKYVEKATSTKTKTNAAFDLVYGNYVRCNEVAGITDFTIAEYVSLRDAPGNYLSVTFPTAISAPGTEIGKARVRSVVHESGTPGTPECVYRIYLFDIKMSSGKNFRDVESISGTEAIADPILEAAPGASPTPVCRLYEPEKNSLLIDTKLPLASANNISYRFRTIKTDTLYPGIGSEGTIIVNDDASPDIQLPYSGALTTEEKEQILVIPQSTVVASVNIAGSITGTSGVATGSATDFVNELEAGDYFQAAGSLYRVEAIASSTSLTYSPISAIGAGSNVAIAFPDNVPIDLNRAGRSATSTSSALTIGLGVDIASNTSVKVVVNEEFVNSDPITKTITRDAYVLIQANTHVNGVSGPWSLGLPDVIRLNGVYAGSNTSATNITEHFFIEDGQRDNYYDLCELKKDPQSSYTIGTDDVILVHFVVATHTAGIKTVTSYPLNDETALGSLAGQINTLEIPEFEDRQYHDLRECFDFRPLVANTVIVAVTEGTAPTNPKTYGPTANASHVANSSKFSGSGRKFPVPEGDLFLDYVEYQPRIDTIIINTAGEFDFLVGENKTASTPSEMVLYKSYIPPYPSIAQQLSKDMNDIANKRMWSQGVEMTGRRDNYTISVESIDEQIPGYTMEAIHKMNLRLKVLEEKECCIKEAEIKEKVIPSTQDPKINRYKFGFYVDEFDNISLTDVTNRTNLSNIYNGKLYPKTSQYDIKLRLSTLDGDKLASNLKFPHEDTLIIQQKIATDGPVIVPAQNTAPEPAPVIKPTSTEQATTPTAPSTNTVSTVTVTDAPKIITNEAFVVSPSSYRYATTPVPFIQDYTFSSNTQADGTQVVLYFSNLNTIGDSIKIYQYNNVFVPGSTTTILDTLITDTGSPVTSLTGNDLTYLRNKGLAFTDRTPTSTWYSTAAPANDGNPGYLFNNGKVVWNYNPAYGRNFRVQIEKRNATQSGFCYFLVYPGDQVVRSQTTPIISNTITPPRTIVYPKRAGIARPITRKEPTVPTDRAYVWYRLYSKKIDDFNYHRVAGGLSSIGWDIKNPKGGEYKVFYKNIDVTKYCESLQRKDGGLFEWVKTLAEDKNLIWQNDYDIILKFMPSELMLLGLFDQDQYNAAKAQIPYTSYASQQDAYTAVQNGYAWGSGGRNVNTSFQMDISIISISSPDLANMQTVDINGELISYIPNYNGFGMPKSTGSNIDRRIVATTNDYVDVYGGRVPNQDKILALVQAVTAAKGSQKYDTGLYYRVYNQVRDAFQKDRIITSAHANNLYKILRG